jgi:hypothetical protein
VVTGGGNGGLAGAAAMVRAGAMWKPPSCAAMVIVDGAVAKGDGRGRRLCGGTSGEKLTRFSALVNCD